MVIKHCGYWQTNISSYLHTDLNANVFTREAEKVIGRSLLNCRTLRISLIQGHRTRTSKRYEGPNHFQHALCRQVSKILHVPFGCRHVRSYGNHSQINDCHESSRNTPGPHSEEVKSLTFRNPPSLGKKHFLSSSVFPNQSTINT